MAIQSEIFGTIWDDDMNRGHATIRLISASRTASELAEIANRPPSFSHDRGDLTSPRNDKSARYVEAMIVFESDLERTVPLDSHLSSLSGLIAHLANTQPWPSDVDMELILSVQAVTSSTEVAVSALVVQQIASINGTVHFYADPA